MERPDLTPAIVQDAETGRVLMLAWMEVASSEPGGIIPCTRSQ